MLTTLLYLTRKTDVNKHFSTSFDPFKTIIKNTYTYITITLIILGFFFSDRRYKNYPK